MRGRRRYRAAVAGSIATLALMTSGCEAQVTESKPLDGVPGTPFSDGGAWVYNYVTENEGYRATRFAELTEQVTSGEFTDRGITNIMVYGPYASTRAWRGLPPTGDFMDVDPANGTLQEWRELVAQANSRGITVTVYLALLYLDESSPLFVQAQQDRAAGVDSWQANLLLWDPRVESGGERSPSDPPGERDYPRPEEGRWAYSQIASQWYATSWRHPAIYYGNESAMDFAKQVMRFWMDHGAQGFEIDAPHTMWGFHEGDAADARHRELVTYPEQYRPDWQTYRMAEGSGSYEWAEWLDAVGYTHVLLNGDDDVDNFVQRTIRGEITVDDLDRHYQEVIDTRRENGRGSYAPCLYVRDFEPRRLALDLAVQGGAGAIISFDQQEILALLDDGQLASIDEVTKALDASPAEAPSASRQRLPSVAAGASYAMLRVAADGTRAAVNVYNLTG